MNRQKIIKTFEGFHKYKLDSLISKGSTYIKKKIRILEDSNTEEFNRLISKLRDYDFGGFHIDIKSYGIFIKPDKNFDNLYKRICDITGNEYSNLNFYISITTDDNIIDFDGGVPDILRGLSIGYKLYKLVIDVKKFITSNKYSTKDAYNLWYNLLMDNDLYALTSKNKSILITKNITNDDLLSLINRYNDLEMSDDLLVKMEEIKISKE